MGHEPAGKIVAVGDGVSDYKVGDKVAVSPHVQGLSFQIEGLSECFFFNVQAYLSGGGLANYVVAPEKALAKLPDSVSTRDGAASLLQGLTVLTMIREACEAKKGQYILVSLSARHPCIAKEPC